MKDFIKEHKIQLYNTNSSCYIFEEVTSTFDIAYELLKDNKFPEWSSVLAYSQTNGRGQLGHKWSSPKGNLSATIRLPKSSIFNTEAIAPILGGILIKNLKNIFQGENSELSTNFCLKWTNDLIINTNNNYFKIGGILIEERENAIFAGIGINVHTKANFMLDDNNIALPSRHLSQFYKIEEKDILTLWIKLVNFINLCYFSESSNGMDCIARESLQELDINKDFIRQKDFLQNANNHLAFRGLKVNIINALPANSFDYTKEGEQITEYTGILKSISLEIETLGGIIIDTNYGLKTFISGSIRLV